MERKNAPYQKLKADIQAGCPGLLYVFFGEEKYLLEHYLGKIAETIVTDGFSAFDDVRLEGGSLTETALWDAIDAPPFSGGRKLVVVRDFDLMKPGKLKDALPELLGSLPAYVCLVFQYDGLEFKPDKRLTIYKTLNRQAEMVEFEKAPPHELIPWVKRRFKARGKDIDTAACEYFLFICGTQMTGLVGEIDKIASGADGQTITRDEIDALGSRVIEARVFALTDHMLAGSHGAALALLRDLFAARSEPVAVLAAIASQLRNLYGAKLARRAGKDEAFVMNLCGLYSPYPARLLLRAAQNVSLEAVRKMQLLVCDADSDIKSSVPDPQRVVELLILQMADVLV